MRLNFLCLKTIGKLKMPQIKSKIRIKSFFYRVWFGVGVRVRFGVGVEAETPRPD
jgi:hypothetical protein